MKNGVIIAIIIIALVGAGIWYYMSNKSADDTSTASDDGGSTEKTDKEKLLDLAKQGGNALLDRRAKNKQLNVIASSATSKYNSTSGSERDKIKAIKPMMTEAAGLGFKLIWEKNKFVPHKA